MRFARASLITDAMAGVTFRSCIDKPHDAATVMQLTESSENATVCAVGLQNGLVVRAVNSNDKTAPAYAGTAVK